MVDRKTGPSGIGEDAASAAEQQAGLLNFLQKPGVITLFLGGFNDGNWRLALRLRNPGPRIEEVTFFELGIKTLQTLSVESLSDEVLKTRVEDAQAQLASALQTKSGQSFPTSAKEADR